LHHGLPFAQINLKPSLIRRPTVRKYIIPGSVRIYGLPGTDDNFGIRDNSSGQMWSQTKKVGSINYWTGDVVLDKACVPKVRFWDELLVLLGFKSTALPNLSYKYEVSYLNTEAVTEPRTTGSEIHPLVVIGDYRRR
jgi:hypothetical protein